MKIDPTKLSKYSKEELVKFYVEARDRLGVLTATRKIVGEELGVKKTSFIEDFKKHIGDEYLNKIEKIGVNLHFLEFKFV